MNNEIFLPVLHHFENGNVFTGSCGAFRYQITPDIVKQGKEISLAECSMKAEYWHGLLCYEKSDIEGEKTFPLTPEGRQQLHDWLLAAV